MSRAGELDVTPILAQESLSEIPGTLLIEVVFETDRGWTCGRSILFQVRE